MERMGFEHRTRFNLTVKTLNPRLYWLGVTTLFTTYILVGSITKSSQCIISNIMHALSWRSWSK